MAVLFFDTSALVRRYDRTEPGAGRVRALCARAAGHTLLISRLAPVEIASALNRKLRAGALDEPQHDRLWRRFRLHRREQYRLVALDEPVYQRAEQLLVLHRLRAYDPLQLAAGLRVAELLLGLAPDFRFCTADRTQAQAAGREGPAVEVIT